MPKQWGQPNEKKGKRIFIAPDSELGDKQDEARLEKLPTSEQWKVRLANLKIRQEAAGAIKNYDAAQSEILAESTSSVLACLQTPITAQRIKKQIETTYFNGLQRVAGLKLFADLADVYISKEANYEYLNWFCSSLRSNKN